MGDMRRTLWNAVWGGRSGNAHRL